MFVLLSLCVSVPRQPGNNDDWEFDIELGNTAEDARDDPGTSQIHLFKINSSIS